jgi:hypothetical protein
MRDGADGDDQELPVGFGVEAMPAASVGRDHRGAGCQAWAAIARGPAARPAAVAAGRSPGPTIEPAVPFA